MVCCAVTGWWRLAAIEALGATSVPCVDKNGTLTENRMTVVQLNANAASTSPSASTPLGERLTIDPTTSTDLPEVLRTLVQFSILASASDPFDPMKKAFHRLGQHVLQGTEHLYRDWTLKQADGLTPELRAMSHVWLASLFRFGELPWAFLGGAMGLGLFSVVWFEGVKLIWRGVASRLWPLRPNSP